MAPMAEDPQAARLGGETDVFSPNDFANALAPADVDGALRETAVAARRRKGFGEQRTSWRMRGASWKPPERSGSTSRRG